MPRKQTQHKTTVYRPSALIYFIDKDWMFSTDLTNLSVTSVDIPDVMDISITRGNLGVVGKFTLKINNENNRYFITDDIENAVMNLNKLSDANTRYNDDKIKKDPYPFRTAADFLNNSEYNRHPKPEDIQVPGTTLDFTQEVVLEKNAEGDLGYYNGGLDPNKSPSADVIKSEFTTLSPEVRDRIISNAPINADFFTKLGGDLLHGKCVFESMQRVVILFSRRIASNANQNMISVFTGMVTAVTDSYEENIHTLVITGEDMTKWLRLTQVNVNPAVITSNLPLSGVVQITQNKFANMEGWEIIKTLVIGGQDAENQNSLQGLGVYEVKATGPHIDPTQQTTGFTGTALNSLSIDDKLTLFPSNKLHLQTYYGISEVRDADGTHVTTPYKLFFNSSINTFENEYKNAWDIIQDITKITNFEFYADAMGDFWYHQPRFNNWHILNYPAEKGGPAVYTIQDEDILSSNFTESETEVITTIIANGMMDVLDATGMEVPLEMVNYYEDPGLVFKYGRRIITVHHPFIRTTEDCFFFAKSLMMRINAERFNGQITILGRPEIQPAMPVYIAYRNMIYYIKTVEHRYTFGGKFVTTLQLTYGHKPWEILPELLDYRTSTTIEAQNAASQISAHDLSAKFNTVANAINAAVRTYNVPLWVMQRIAFVESTFEPSATRGQKYDSQGKPVRDYSLGLFQITPAVLQDYNTLARPTTLLTEADLLNPDSNSLVAAWHINRLFTVYSSSPDQIELTVRAYNAGTGAVNSEDATEYWRRFQAAGTYFTQG